MANHRQNMNHTDKYGFQPIIVKTTGVNAGHALATLVNKSPPETHFLKFQLRSDVDHVATDAIVAMTIELSKHGGDNFLRYKDCFLAVCGDNPDNKHKEDEACVFFPNPDEELDDKDIYRCVALNALENPVRFFQYMQNITVENAETIFKPLNDLFLAIFNLSVHTGFTHRDLHLDNIQYVTQSNKCVIIDYGRANISWASVSKDNIENLQRGINEVIAHIFSNDDNIKLSKLENNEKLRWRRALDSIFSNNRYDICIQDAMRIGVPAMFDIATACMGIYIELIAKNFTSETILGNFNGLFKVGSYKGETVIKVTKDASSLEPYILPQSEYTGFEVIYPGLAFFARVLLMLVDKGFLKNDIFITDHYIFKYAKIIGSNTPTLFGTLFGGTPHVMFHSFQFFRAPILMVQDDVRNLLIGLIDGRLKKNQQAGYATSVDCRTHIKKVRLVKQRGGKMPAYPKNMSLTRDVDESNFDAWMAKYPKHFHNQQCAGGVHTPQKKTDEKTYVLGRERCVYLVGRKKHIKVQGHFVSLQEARKKDARKMQQISKK
jgi:hypothetical protein